MYSLVTALVVTLLTIALPGVFGVDAKWTVLPAIVLGVVTFITLGRRIGKRIEAINAAADAEMQALQTMAQQMAQRPQTRNPQLLGQRIDNAVAIYKRGLFLQRWQFGVGTMLNARIGMMLFTRLQIVPDSNLAEAIPYLEKARVTGRKAALFSGMWPAWAMLGVAHYKSGKAHFEKMKSVFESSLAHVRKEPMFWQVYAYILHKEGDADGAIGVLARAHEALPDDAAVTENLTALQNGKKMSMRAYGDPWYQFGLETPKMPLAPRMPHPRTRTTSKRR